MPRRGSVYWGSMGQPSRPQQSPGIVAASCCSVLNFSRRMPVHSAEELLGPNGLRQDWHDRWIGLWGRSVANAESSRVLPEKLVGGGGLIVLRKRALSTAADLQRNLPRSQLWARAGRLSEGVRVRPATSRIARTSRCAGIPASGDGEERPVRRGRATCCRDDRCVRGFGESEGVEVRTRGILHRSRCRIACGHCCSPQRSRSGMRGGSAGREEQWVHVPRCLALRRMSCRECTD